MKAKTMIHVQRTSSRYFRAQRELNGPFEYFASIQNAREADRGNNPSTVNGFAVSKGPKIMGVFASIADAEQYAAEQSKPVYKKSPFTRETSTVNSESQEQEPTTNDDHAAGE